MKNIIVGVALLASASSASAMTPSDGLKQAPDIVCNDHPNHDQCVSAVKAIMFGTYSFTALDEQCDSSSDSVKAKMGAEMKAQCAAAKDATEYLKTLRR